MSLVLELSEQFGWVLAVASSTFFVNYLHMARTVKYRKTSGITYPVSYATEEQAAKNKEAYKFNCAQRAHANYIENQPSFLGALLISGLRYPFAATILGSVWVVGRIVYLFGYTSDSGPKGRSFGGAFSMISDLALRSLALYTSVTYALGQ